MLKPVGILYSLLILTLFVSCQKNSAQADSYFDSLVVAQVAHLSNVKASLMKKATLDGKVDQSTFTPDSTTWENELGIFRQLSAFERPAYRQAYRVEDGIKDVTSNLIIRRYQAPQQIPVPELRFYYLNQFRNLKKIEAIYRQQNLLYVTTRHLSMEFEEIAGKPILIVYRIEGAQKMFLGDSVKFSIQSEITN
jgi:hypothetical protein